MPQQPELAAQFAKTYPDGGAPRFCRVPGRVNLVGEHVDYNGLSVLPMAIDRELLAAFAPRSDCQVRVASTDPRFEPGAFENAAEIAPSDSGSWINYVKAACQAINAVYFDGRLPKQSGMDLLVTSNLRDAAGLSSSSALVVASALAYLACKDWYLDADIQRLELADVLADGERYVGTQSGGMDHAIILTGARGHAFKIDFGPLRVEPVPMLSDVAVVLCDSGLRAAKSGSARSRYNEGPALGRLICAMIEKQAQLTFGDEIEFATLGEIWSGPLCLTHNEAGELFETTFMTPRTTLTQAAKFLEVNEAVVRSRYIGDLDEPKDGFALQARARHQRMELLRVEHARDCLLAGDAPGLGALLVESHESCSRDLEVSTPELDSLVEHAMACGSLGSRLTGAGFGGCTVNLVPSDAVEEFSRSIWDRYFASPSAATGFSSRAEAVTSVMSSDGASYLET